MLKRLFEIASEVKIINFFPCYGRGAFRDGTAHNIGTLLIQMLDIHRAFGTK
jgi:hypothetical protein